jgi:CBS domain containing-hemolysin-like protein
MSFIEQKRRLLVSVFPLIAIQLSLTSLSISDQFLQYGIWMYLMVFVIVTLGSTVVGGLIPDNTFLFLTGAVARVNGLSMEWRAPRCLRQVYSCSTGHPETEYDEGV